MLKPTKSESVQRTTFLKTVHACRRLVVLLCLPQQGCRNFQFVCESEAGGPPADPSGIMCVFCACTMVREKRKKTEASISTRVCFICLHLCTYSALVLKEPHAKISNYI